MDQIARSRLAVGAGNSNHGQVARRVVIERCCQMSQRLARILHADVGHVQPFERLFANYGRGAAPNCLGNKSMSIVGAAAHRNE